GFERRLEILVLPLERIEVASGARDIARLFHGLTDVSHRRAGLGDPGGGELLAGHNGVEDRRAELDQARKAGALRLGRLALDDLFRAADLVLERQELRRVLRAELFEPAGALLLGRRLHAWAG